MFSKVDDHQVSRSTTKGKIHATRPVNRSENWKIEEKTTWAASGDEIDKCKKCKKWQADPEETRPNWIVELYKHLQKKKRRHYLLIGS